MTLEIRDQVCLELTEGYYAERGVRQSQGCKWDTVGNDGTECH